MRSAKAQWDDVKVAQEAMRITIADEADVKRVLDSNALEGKSVVTVKNCTNCEFVLPRDLPYELVKLFVESCEGCSVSVEVCRLSVEWSSVRWVTLHLVP